MIRLPCPHCGPRNSSEFRFVGERSARPVPDGVAPQEWRGYLYERRNELGWSRESWYHTYGCRRFFAVERHTLTNEVRIAGEPQPTGRTSEPDVTTVTDLGAESPA